MKKKMCIVDGRADEPKVRRTDEQRDGRADGTAKGAEGRIIEQTDGWMVGRMNERPNPAS